MTKALRVSSRWDRWGVALAVIAGLYSAFAAGNWWYIIVHGTGASASWVSSSPLLESVATVACITIGIAGLSAVRSVAGRLFWLVATADGLVRHLWRLIAPTLAIEPSRLAGTIQLTLVALFMLGLLVYRLQVYRLQRPFSLIG